MNLTERIDLAARLGDYLTSSDPVWQGAKEQAYLSNPWFTPEFISLATEQLARCFLDKKALQQWVADAGIPETNASPITVGLVMAGNLPLVGFHDWLCLFITGHHGRIKLSSQDNILFQHIREKLIVWNSEIAPHSRIEDRLTGADAFIATGSDHTARYFEYYFGRFPHIIRKNRSSVAVLTGQESTEELERLSADMYTFFGRGCRNVTQLLVPRHYTFEPLLNAGSAFRHLKEHHKFRNNYEYQLALRILNNEFYMTNDIALFVEQDALHAPIGLIHYRYYEDLMEVEQRLAAQQDQIQCRLGLGGIPFGMAQQPGLDDYADGVNTLAFLLGLPKSS